MKLKHLTIIFLIILGFNQCKRADAENINNVTANEVKENLKVVQGPEKAIPDFSEKRKAYLVNDQKLIFNNDYKDSILSLNKEFPISIFSINENVDQKAVSILSEAGFKSIYILKDGIKSLNP